MIAAPHIYSVYGLSISSDRPLTGLLPVRAAGPMLTDLDIRFGSHEQGSPKADGEERLWYTSDILDENGNPGLSIWRSKADRAFSVRYVSELRFDVDAGLRCLTVTGAESMSDADVSSFLLGPVIGIFLRMKGMTCLHASAVALQGRAVVFTGDEGCGKSTVAALFARHGHAVLTDDIAALEFIGGKIRVRPGYPMLNLLSDSVRLLFGSEEALPEPDPAVGKRRMALGEGFAQFQGESLDLGAVFVLDDRPTQMPGIQVDALTQRSGLVELASRTYANKMLDSEMRAAEFRFLGTLLKSIPVLRLRGLFSVHNLGKAYRSICDAAAAAMGADAYSAC